METVPLPKAAGNTKAVSAQYSSEKPFIFKDLSLNKINLFTVKES